MQPYDYTSAFAGVQPVGEAIMGGFKNGVGIQQMQAERAKAEQARAQQAQLQADLAALAQNPTTRGMAQLTLKYPHLSEPIKRTFDMMEPSERQAKIERAVPVFSALHKGKPDIAIKLLKEQGIAMRNSGDEEGAKAADVMLRQIEADPGFAQTNAYTALSAAMGPEKFAVTLKALGEETRANALAPAELAKAKADAIKADADAAVAQGTIPALIDKPVQDNLSAEVKRRIDQMNAEINAADSETKRGQLTLERDKFISEQGLKGIERGDAAQSQIDSAQHALITIAALRKDPLLKDSAGNYVAGVGTVLGKMLGNIPGTDNKDFRGKLESLKSQIFLPAVQQVKGMGALSNAEGEKLTAAVESLDADMSPGALKNALGMVERYMQKGLQKGLANKNAPTTGGGFVINHPTYGPVREGDINRLMKQHPGATRDQVMRYLSQTGAK